MKKQILFLVLLSFVIATSCSWKISKGNHNFPGEKDFELVAPASRGGGWDATVRAMRKVLMEEGLVKNKIRVVNKTGGGGELGWDYIREKDAHTLAVNSSLLLTNQLLEKSDLSYKDFTPLAIIVSEWEAVVVRKGSNLHSAAELMTNLKKNPGLLRVGIGPGLANDDQLSFIQAAKSYGVEIAQINFHLYRKPSNSIEGLIDGEVDVVPISLSEVINSYKNGKVKILALSSAERLEGLEGVPTWKEQGVDMVFPHWRGVMGPPGMTEKEIAFWDTKLGKMVQADTWQKILRKNEWQSFYKDSSDTKRFLEEQMKKYKEILNQ